MRILNKESVLMGIAAKVGKGALYFDLSDRPSVMMGGRNLGISSVAFDPLEGVLTYDVSDKSGKVLSSSFGVRRLEHLDDSFLNAVSKVVDKYAALRNGRGRGLEAIKNMVNFAVKNNSAKALRR